MKLHRPIRSEESLDRSSTFVEVQKLGEKHPRQVSVEDLLGPVKIPGVHGRGIGDEIDENTIVLDPSTLKIRVNRDALAVPNVFSGPYDGQHVYHDRPPADASASSGMHMVANENYLYVWVGNRWKRAVLSEW